jgi:TolB protein
MRINRRFALSISIVLGLAASYLDPGNAQEDAGGKIAFYSLRDGRADIFVMNADGTGLRKLTRGGRGGKCPAFSPDGRLIAFQPDTESDEDIYLMDADGSNVRPLIDSPGNERHAAWSRDGRRIAFQSDRDGNPEIYIMEVDGGTWRRLTHNPADEMWPSWSPDGNQIAFNSDRDGNWDIYIVDADGSNERPLTESPQWELFPAWSPDGMRILFRSGRPGVFEGNLHTIAPDGSHERRLTEHEGMEEDPAWSPDGGLIAFQSMKEDNFDIYIMAAEGGEWKNLTQHPAHDYWPTWAPGRVDRDQPRGRADRSSSQDEVRIQVVYDDHCPSEGLTCGAGFASLVKLGDRVLLFDTGADGEALLSNLARIGTDPADIDLVFISHNHSDHVAGLPQLSERWAKPELFLLEKLPENLTGRAPEFVAGILERSKEQTSKVVTVAGPTEILRHVHSTGPVGTRIPEQALIIQTERGPTVITGCAHPGVGNLVRRARDLFDQEVSW